MHRLSALMRFWILVSAVWFICWIAATVNFYQAEDKTGCILAAVLPLLIGWGIWWIRRAKS